jgi:adenylosuccinate lyase
MPHGPPPDEARVYDNPLVTRYASRDMAELWGPRRKFGTWRRLWVALAEAQQELGLTAADGVTARIRREQLAAMRAHVDDIDFDRAAAHERRLRHDVMAHIHTYAEACPEARASSTWGRPAVTSPTTPTCS